MKNVTRRGLLKGVFGVGAAAAGARIVGPFVPEAAAALDTPHFVHVFFHGGLNALFTGCAQQLRGKFSVTDTNMVEVGNGVHTDKGTFGTFPKIALDHWAAIGVRHGDANHTVPENRNGGGEMSMIRNGQNTYLNQLAAAMGGDSAFKAILTGRRNSGNYGVFGNWPAVDGVSLQRVTNLKDALSAVGADKPNPDAPNRERLASTLEASHDISGRQLATNPGRLASLGESYDAAVAALRKPLPPPVTYDEVDKAYGLGGRTAIVPGGKTSYAAQFALAEIMIRAAGTNVVHITDFDPMWDFDANVNGPRSRNAFVGKDWGYYNRLVPIRTFLERMLDFPGKNVVVAISGEFVRQTSGHGHGGGIVTAVFGKNVKQGLMFPVDGNARFSTNTPPPKAFWAGIAAACQVPGQPFGANPYKLLG